MSKNTQISELINYISVDGSGNVVFTTVPAAASNTDKFLVSDAGTLKFRTAAQLLSDIGAQASGSYLTTSSASSTYLPLVGGTLTGGLIGTTASFSSFITAQSTGGSGLRIYGSSGTNQWDIYLNSTNLRFSDNTGTGSVVFDRPISGTSTTFTGTISGGGNFELVNAGGPYVLVGEGTGVNQYAAIDWDATNNRLRIATQPYAFGANGGQITLTTGGLVGIGTTSPTTKLHVIGTSTFTDEAYFTDKLGVGTVSLTYKAEVAGAIGNYWNGSAFTGTPLALTISNTQSGGYDPVLLYRQTDSGGTTKLAGGIGIVGTSAWTAGNNASQTSDMYFLVRNDSGGITERLRIKTDGNIGVTAVGIGTTSPALNRKLTVAGGVQITYGDNSGASFNIVPGTNGQDGADFNLSYYTGTGYGPLTFTLGGGEKVRIASNGYLGLLNTDPQARLHIGAALSNSADATNGLILKQTSTNETTGIYLERSGERKGYAIYVGGSLDSLVFQRNNAGTKSDVLTLTRDAYVGIGEGSPWHKLIVKTATNNNFDLYDNTSGIGIQSVSDGNINYRSMTIGASSFLFQTAAGTALTINSSNAASFTSTISSPTIVGGIFYTETSSVSNVGTSFVDSGTVFGNATGVWLVSLTAFGDGNMYSAALYVVTTAAYSKTINLIGGPSSHFGNGSVVAELSTTDGISASLRVRRTTVGSATVYVKVMKTGS